MSICMSILNLLALIFACIMCLIMLLMPYLMIVAGILIFVNIIAIIYYSNTPPLKMHDTEIPIEKVTFIPRNLLIEKEPNAYQNY